MRERERAWKKVISWVILHSRDTRWNLCEQTFLHVPCVEALVRVNLIHGEKPESEPALSSVFCNIPLTYFECCMTRVILFCSCRVCISVSIDFFICKDLKYAIDSKWQWQVHRFISIQLAMGLHTMAPVVRNMIEPVQLLYVLMFSVSLIHMDKIYVDKVCQVCFVCFWVLARRIH